jgi:hypothetical protein
MINFNKYHLCLGYPYGECDEMVLVRRRYCPKCRVKASKESHRVAQHNHWYRKEYGYEEINHDDNYGNAIYAG